MLAAAGTDDHLSVGLGGGFRGRLGLGGRVLVATDVRERQ